MKKTFFLAALCIFVFKHPLFGEQNRTSVEVAFRIDWTFGCYQETTFSNISQSLMSPRFQLETSILHDNFMHKITLDYFYGKPQSAMTDTAVVYKKFDPISGETYYEAFQSKLQFHRIRAQYDLLYGMPENGKLKFYAGGSISTNVYMQFENYPSITGIVSIGPSAALDYKIDSQNSVLLSCGIPLLGYGVRPSYAGCDAKLMKYAEEDFFKVLTLGNFLSLHNYQSVFLNAEYKVQVAKNFAIGLGAGFEYSRIAVPKEKPLYFINGNFSTMAVVSF